jgi:hypothetical protein
VARSYFLFARRHGRPNWLAWHLAYSVRRIQRASGREERLATLHGLWDGIRGRRGPHPRYQSQLGELPAPTTDTSGTGPGHRPD